MRRIYRVPAIVALCWGAVLLMMMPEAAQLMRPDGVTVTWNALMYAEGLLLMLCWWAQQASSSDAWTRMLVVIALLLAIYVGVDLNEARDAQQVFDSTGSYSIHYASAGTAFHSSKAHHSHTTNHH